MVARDQYSNPVTDVQQTFTLVKGKSLNPVQSLTTFQDHSLQLIDCTALAIYPIKAADVYVEYNIESESQECGLDSSTAAFSCEFKYEEMSQLPYTITVYLGTGTGGAIVTGTAITVPVNPPGAGGGIEYPPCEDLSSVNVLITVISIIVMLIGVTCTHPAPRRARLSAASACYILSTLTREVLTEGAH